PAEETDGHAVATHRAQRARHVEPLAAAVHPMRGGPHDLPERDRRDLELAIDRRVQREGVDHGAQYFSNSTASARAVHRPSGPSAAARSGSRRARSSTAVSARPRSWGKIRIFPENRPSIIARRPSTAASRPPTAPTDRAGESLPPSALSTTIAWS